VKIRNTVILLAVALAIGAYIYFFERKAPTTDEARGLRERVLKIKSDDVEKIRLTKGETSIICEKNVDGTWKMTHPLKVKADSSRVRGIISRAESLKKEREIDLEPGDSEKFGLDKPRAKLGLWHGDTVTELAIGGETPLGGNAYLAVKGDPKACIVSGSFLGDVDKGVDDLRDRTIIDVAVPGVNRLKVSIDGQEIEAVKEGDHWKLVTPVKDRADDDKAKGMLDKLKSLRALEFVADEPSELEAYGLSPPQLEIAFFTGEDMAAKKVSFGRVLKEDAAKIYAKREGADTIFAVRKSVVDNLRKDIDDLRARKLFRAVKGNVEGITVKRGEDILRLEKEGNVWKIVKPFELDAETSRVDKLLGEILDAGVNEFAGFGGAEEKKYGLTSPKVEVSLRLNDGESEGIALGKTGKKLCYVKRDGSEAILGVDKKLEAELTTDALPFVKKEIFSFDRGEVVKLTLKRRDGDFVCKRGDDGEWSFPSPEEGEPGGKKLDSILIKLSHLRAKSVAAMAGKKLKQYGLAKPSIEAGVELKSGEKHALLAGKKCKDGYYAMRKDGRIIYTVPSSLVDTLKADIVRKEEPGKSEE